MPISCSCFHSSGAFWRRCSPLGGKETRLCLLESEKYDMSEGEGRRGGAVARHPALPLRTCSWTPVLGLPDPPRAWEMPGSRLLLGAAQGGGSGVAKRPHLLPLLPPVVSSNLG